MEKTKRVEIEFTDTETKAELAEIKEMLLMLLEKFVLPQNEACKALGISDAAFRQKVLDEKVRVLSSEGSTRNYVTFKEVVGLKPTLRKKRKQR